MSSGDGPVLHQLTFRLSYADCDPAGIVYYAAYYPWMERLYNEWTLDRGHPPMEMRSRWGATHISRASGCEYYVPGKLFDQLRADLRIGSVGRTSFTTVFDIVRTADDVLVARGHIVFVFIDDDGRPTEVPEQFLEALKHEGVVVSAGRSGELAAGQPAGEGGS